MLHSIVISLADCCINHTPFLVKGMSNMALTYPLLHAPYRNHPEKMLVCQKNNKRKTLANIYC